MAKSAALAVQHGADAIVMDDGFQNPTLYKDFSILLIGAGDEEGALFPAGPFRERLDEARRRAQMTVAMGADKNGADHNIMIIFGVSFLSAHGAQIGPLGHPGNGLKTDTAR